MLNFLNSFSFGNQSTDKKKDLAIEPMGEFSLVGEVFESVSGGIKRLNSCLKNPLQEIQDEVWTNLSITVDFCTRIEQYKSYEGFFSKAFYDTLNLSDTSIKIKLNEEPFDLDLNEFISFFPCCNSLQDVSRFILDMLLSYGLFTCQIVPNTKNEIVDFVFPPPWSLKWEIKENEETGRKKWKLIHKNPETKKDQEVDRAFTVYQPLNIIYASHGIYPVPPFKTALEPLSYYKMYTKALRHILGKFGLHKQSIAKINIDELLKLINELNFMSESHGQNHVKKIQVILKDLEKEVINNQTSGMLILPLATDIKNMEAVEVSQSVINMDTLFSDAVFRGLKTTPALMGRSSTNQTTLSNTQKQVLLNQITSYQQKADSALLNILKKYFLYTKQEKIDLNALSIDRTLTVLDNIKDVIEAEILQDQLDKANAQNSQQENINNATNN